MICNFEKDEIESVEDDYIIPPGFVEVSFCTKNEVSSKQFMQKFHNFKGSKLDLWIKCITRQTKTLFKLKDLHPA